MKKNKDILNSSNLSNLSNLSNSSSSSVTLKSAKIHWNQDDVKIKSILGDGNIDIEKLNNDEITYLLKELDRRLIQLWDKVVFERKHNLLDYSKIIKNR